MIWKPILISIVIGVPAYAQEPRVAPDTIQARAQGCSTCHGANGEGTSDINFPRIAGKPSGYIFNQLRNFRDGQRSYPPMNFLLSFMHDDYLHELADYFAMQPPRQEVTMESSTADYEIGGQLATHGDSTHGIPACVLCHGQRLTGIEPGVPGLVGLGSRYIAAQLVSWHVGTRRASDPDCMHDIASRLSEPQIRAVSSYLAAQPVVAPNAPAASGAWITPLACGSQP